MHHVDADRLARCTLLAGFVLLASPALAQAPAPRVARLQYDRPATFASCPDEAFFHNFVAARRGGLDPFTADAAKLITLKVSRTKRDFVVVLAVFDQGGKRLGGDELAGPNCQGIVEDAGRAVVTWLLPLPPAPAPTAPAPTTPEPPPAPVEMPKPPPAVVPPVEPAAPAAPVRVPMVPRVGAGAWADFGPGSAALFGVTVEGGVQRREWGWGGWSLMGTFRWDPQQVGISPPASDVVADVSSSLVAGRLAGCVYRAWSVSLAGCVVGEVGEVQQSVGTRSFLALHQSALFAGGGVSARVEVPLPAGLYVQIATDVVGVGTLAGSTNMAVNVIARRIGGAAGGLGAGLGISL